MQSIKYKGCKLYQKNISQFDKPTASKLKVFFKHQTRNEWTNGLGSFSEIIVEKGQRIEQTVDTDNQNKPIHSSQQ